MNNENPIVIEKDYAMIQSYRICWSAVFSGALVGLGLVFLLHLYAVAIGLSAYSSTPNGASVIALGGLLGMVIGVIASMVTAGFLAGYLGRFHYYPLNGGIVYGFITWSLIIVLCALSAKPMGSYISNYGQALSNSRVEAPLVQVSNAENTTIDSQGTIKNAPVAVVSPKELAWSSWVIFLLFFIGALSSCAGACWGMGCKRDNTPNIS